MDRAALNQLESYIRGGVKASNGSGIELGGLVLGSSFDTKSEVVITRFVPVEIKHRFGPEFRPSGADVALFKGAIASANDRPIGYFRSHLCDEPAIRDEDLSLLGALFPATESCFLVIHASPNTPSNVDLYQVRTGVPPDLLELFALVESEPSAPVPPPVSPPGPEEIPQGPKPSAATKPGAGLGDRHANLAKPATQSTPPMDVTPPIAEDVPPSAKPAESAPIIHVDDATRHSDRPLAGTDKRWTWIFVGVAVIILAIGIFFVDQRPVSAPPAISFPPPKTEVREAAKPKVDLQVIEQGPQIRISWNPASPSVASAVRGMLIITGPASANIPPSTSEEIDLNAEQMHAGLYLYRALNDSLTVQFVIYQLDGSLTGEMRLFTRAPEQSKPSNLSTLSTAIPPAVPPSTTRQSVSDAQVPAQSLPVTAEAVSNPAQAVAAETLPSSVTVAPNLQAVTSPGITSPPIQLEPPPAKSATAVSDIPPVTVPVPSPPPPSNPTLVYQPSETVHKRLLAPRLIHQVVPGVPRGIASRIRTEVKIDVSGDRRR